MKRRKFHVDEVDAMEDRYIFLRKMLESPKGSDPRVDHIDGGKKEYDKHIVEMSFLGKWLQTARRFMDKRPIVETWDRIGEEFTPKISGKTLKNRWKQLGVPIRFSAWKRVPFAYIDELRRYVEKNISTPPMALSS